MGPASPPSHRGYSNHLSRMCMLSPPLGFNSRMHVGTHACGAAHPPWRLLHPILGVLTHIAVPCLYSFVYVLVHATSDTFDTTKANKTLPPQNSFRAFYLHVIPRHTTNDQPTQQHRFNHGLVVPRMVCNHGLVVPRPVCIGPTLPQLDLHGLALSRKLCS